MREKEIIRVNHLKVLYKLPGGISTRLRYIHYRVCTVIIGLSFWISFSVPPRRPEISLATGCIAYSNLGAWLL